jgi:hypothetical protein
MQPLEMNQVRLDGELHESPAPAFSTNIINILYEFTKCQIFPPAMIGFHEMKYGPGNRK